MRIEVISPHGFCAGVERALKMAHQAIEKTGNGMAVYGLHEIVHNEMVVRELAAKGLRFVESVADVPAGATLLISAHGTSPANFRMAEVRRLRIIDATCPFVAAGHAKIRANFARGVRTVVIGTPDHAEVRGYLGEPGACLPEDVKPGERTEQIVQTTHDAGAHEGVCTATRDRQRAVREFVEMRRQSAAVGVLVVGGAKSANTRRLAEIAEQEGAHAWRIGSPDEVTTIDFEGIDILGATSGASTPESQFRAILKNVCTAGGDMVSYAPFLEEWLSG